MRPLSRAGKAAAFSGAFLILTTAAASAVTLTVKSTADAGGTCPGSDCTLRQAIATAFAGDSIDFALISNSVITLTSGELLINKALTITGPSSALLTVQRSSAAGTPDFRVFEVTGNAITIGISNLTMSNGSSPDNGGGLYFHGGGASNQGPALILTNITISGNAAHNGSGGGIYKTAGSLTIVNSTVSGNSATADGGGIYNVGTGGDTGDLILSTSTITGNMAGGNGGGLVTGIATSSQISNSTIARNSAGNDAGGIYAFQGQANTIDTIIALNTAPSDSDIFGNFVSQGYNLIGNVSAGTTITGITTGNQLNVNPLLGPLQDNGGLTKTLALLSGSPAIEGGKAGSFLADQRGLARPVDDPLIGNASGGDGSDIGAYEAQADLLPGCKNISTVVTTTNDSGAGSLRDVIASVCQGVTITFNPAVRPAINLTSAELVIFKNVTIKGPGADLLAVQRSAAGGTPNFRIFNIVGQFNAAISGLTIGNGNNANLDNGGGIYSSATLSLVDIAISGNKSANAGGGIDNDGGTLTLLNSTVSGNSVGNPVRGVIGGAGILNGGTANITNSTISGNSVPAGTGGGILNGANTLTLSNTTISANSASHGGGISNSSGATVQSKNTIIALNTAPNAPDFNGALTSNGFNVVGNSSGATIAPAQFSDFIGVTSAQLNLGPLQNNGGTTQTHALLLGSIAIDQGNASGFVLDQRAFTRPVDQINIANGPGGDGSDIGAFEFGGLPFRVISIVRNSSDIVVTFEAVAGAIYRLERKLTLTDSSWQSISGVNELLAGSSGPASITHPGGANVPTAFYRIVLVQ